MRLRYRFVYFGGGFSLGILILFFFLSGKKTSCDYFPNARVLKQIRLKERIISEEAILFLNSKNIDTSAVTKVLENGNVLFSESDKEKEPCPEYSIEGEVLSNTSSFKGKLLKLKVAYCDKNATILSAQLVSE